MTLACHIGPVTIPGFARSENTMACQLPTKKPGNYTVQVTCAAGSEILGIFPIEYAQPPRIERFEPQVVPVGGAFPLDFYGVNFDRGDMIYCIFGEASMRVQASFISPSRIKCLTRRHWVAGEVQLTVVLETYDGRTEVMLQSPFNFATTIAETSGLNPDFGSVVGGYPITIAVNSSWRSFRNVSC
ncbi:hypothetical protein PHYSODRAFT_451698, partial [Phytophthora sojae]